MAEVGLPQFSIYEELWQDCWLAATAAARTKRRQVDYSIQQRIAFLMESYGPQTSMPLSLRVYGTMFKGFCVLNNDRMRGLHADCERMVFAFSQERADGGASFKLAPTKRKHVDAMTLDLDISKVREAETFDWTPLEPGDLLQLPSQLLETNPLSQQVPKEICDDKRKRRKDQESLLLQAALLDEAFPAIDVPPTEPIDAMCAVDIPAPVMLPSLLPLGNGDLELHVEDPFEAAECEELVAAPAQHLVTRKWLPKLLEPGHVHGFDLETSADWEDEGEAQVSMLSGPFAYVTAMPAQAVDHFGQLAFLVDGTGDAVPGSRMPSGMAWQAIADCSEWPIAPTAASRPIRSDTPCVFAPAPVPQLEAARGADEEIARALRLEKSEPERKRRRGAAPKYDEPTTKVGDVLRRYIAATAGAERCITLDDLLPPGKTDKATAARTFHALLTLATAGEFVVDQHLPYVPIAISVA
mmetsp:Transcript_132249/g.382355  ORF Transcript_132249/g.382355 Transcript_132249/m.382355 type:complete len:469 (+) Transcript_132249:94-1500(+)